MTDDGSSYTGEKELASRVWAVPAARAPWPHPQRPRLCEITDLPLFRIFRGETKNRKYIRACFLLAKLVYLSAASAVLQRTAAQRDRSRAEITIDGVPDQVYL